MNIPKDILDNINKSLSEKSCFNGGVYKDEPIIKTAGRLGTPRKITELYEMMRKESFLYMPDPKAFYISAKFMEDFTDDYDRKADFFRYYPTYRDMNQRQLRTYFTWRTKVRKGTVENISISYAYLYIYELLNLIGVGSAEEAFPLLKKFFLDFSVYDDRIMEYYKKWLLEFAVYYGLPREYIGDLYNYEYNGAVSALANYKNKTDKEIAEAVIGLSSYNAENSAFCKENKEDLQAVIAAVYRAWAEHSEKGAGNDLPSRLFGRKFKGSCYMFEDAVFFERGEHEDTDYDVSDILHYSCRNGKWQKEDYVCLYGTKNSDLGKAVREIDRIMRQEYGYKKQLKEQDCPKYLIKIITKEVKNILEEKEKNKRPEIIIDVSSLDRIRKDADITRDKLITEEEKTDSVTSPIPEEAPAANTEDVPLLDGTEKEFISLILNGGDIKGFAMKNNIMLSMTADDINNKLFDIFGDTVIEFENDTPYIVEDYKNDLKEIAAV